MNLETIVDQALEQSKFMRKQDGATWRAGFMEGAVWTMGEIMREERQKIRGELGLLEEPRE